MNWGTPTGAGANDTTYATITGANWDAAELTDELELSGFGFTIPGVITGIQAEVLGWAPAGGAHPYTDVRLMTSTGVYVGTDKATGALPTADPGSTYTSFGGSADTWSSSLTATQANASTFGVALCFTAAGANSTINIDHIRVTLTYNEPPTLSVAQPDGVGDTVTVGDSYNVTYTLGDADNVATAAFFYDTDNTGLNGTAISGACATAAEGTGVTCAWNTTGVTPGSYYVYGTANDGVNSAVSTYSSGQITINAPAAAPTVATNAASAGVAGATLNGTISATGGQNATARGFAWGTNSALSGGDTSTTTESGSFGTGAFSRALINILSNKTYYVRAYATNPAGTGYGSIESFVTGTNTLLSRLLLLFQGSRLNLTSGKLIINQK